METRASHVLVGVFVLSLIAAAVVFILWLGGNTGASADTHTYRVKFDGDVTGLEVGAKVRFRGIPVGTVTDIGLDKQDPEQVSVLVAVRRDTPIRTTTRASIETQGLTGAPFIQLQGVNREDGDEPGPILVPAAGQAPPVIRGQTTGIARILEEFPKAVKAITNLANEIRRLVNKDNRDEIAAILKSARRTVNNIEKASQEAQPLLAEVRQVARKVDSAIDDVRKFTGTANKIASKIDKVIDGVNKVVSSADKVVTGSQDAVKEIGKGAKAFAALSWEFRALVRENRRPLNDFASTGLYEFSLFLTDMRKFVRTADRFIKKMSNDPAGFFFGNRQKGFTTRGNR